MPFLNLILLFFLLFSAVTYSFDIPEGVEFSAVVLKNRWDMMDRDDVYPLKWANNLKEWTIENGILEGVPKDDDPNFWLLFPGVVSSLKLGKLGENYPIDASRYTKLSFLMWLPEDLPPDEPGCVIYWHKGGDTPEEFGSNFGHTGFIQTYKGWHLYTVDLKNIPYSGVPYDGIVKGLRIDPCVRCKSFKIAWVRLVSGKDSRSKVPAPGIESIIVDTDNTSENGFLTAIDNRDGYLDFSILPPGRYYVAFIPDVDYATSSGNTWDMKDENDADMVDGFSDFSFGEWGFSGATSTNDPFIVLKVNQSKPIDAGEYCYLVMDISFNRVPPEDAGMVVYWGHDLYDFSYHSDFIPIYSGFRRYVVNMCKYSGWRGEIRSFRIDPCSTPGINIGIKGVFLSTKSSIEPEDLAPKYYKEPIFIRPAPVGDILSPSSHSGDDYATSVLGNTWEFDDEGDVEGVSNLISCEFTDQIPELGIKGSFFKGISSPAKPGEWGDPGVYLLFQKNDKPLDADRFHWLVLKMYLPGDLDLKNGAVARIIWKRDDWDPGLSTDDIVIYPGLREYVIDLKKVKWEPESDRRWEGLVRYLRVDPHEFPEPREFYLDAVYLRADSESKGVFPIVFKVLQGGDLKADLYYDNDSVGFDGSLIASDLKVKGGNTYTFFWDTHSVPEGRYFLYITLHSKDYTLSYYSKAPVMVKSVASVPVSYHVSVDGKKVSISWSPPSGQVVGYNIYAGFDPNWMRFRAFLGNITRIDFEDVPSGVYYIAITAIFSDGSETPLMIKKLEIR